MQQGKATTAFEPLVMKEMKTAIPVGMTVLYGSG